MDLKTIVCEIVDLIHDSKYGPAARSFEHDNEPSGSITGRKFIY
jgi:hypothetical protein